MDPQEDSSRSDVPDLGQRRDDDVDRIVGRLRDLAHAQSRFQDLLDAVMAVGRELELPVVLRRVITTAMGLVDARYGALGVLSANGEELDEFIPVGLTEREVGDLTGVALPHGRGLLKLLIDHPEPLRVADIGDHPHSVGFPPGHPPMRTLLGVAVTSRGRVYGNLYLSERRDGQPFDVHDEAIVVALAGAAGLAIENARLYQQVRAGAEYFQRLLLPRLPDLDPFETAAVYRPAATPDHVGGDWYDALMLPDDACALVIGDVGGHDLQAAATMAQTRNMLRALLYDRRTPPSAVLTQLDRTLDAITDNPITTACLVRIEPAGDGWTLHWSTAGHPPPLLLSPDGTHRYLHADPGLPLGVDTDLPRPDHKHPLPGDARLILFTDGLVEHPHRPLDAGLAELARIAAAHADLPLDDLCRTLADARVGDGRDDLAVLALRTPP
ncbi:PP2C family protein-serine/threonine phosphatase [Kitasatospora purpeofusca]|uniref:PP2C family protein-serine/threonine phosphatase n=1 Tax=Kitasatospora purpeofusca TaxID=67352 RepID=UPI002252245F|nr:GAF domain-containing SpoIIE family protein phosphatase [Kitasatospora purpeofusca]MCX4757216.1 SpoIIE family protein phosphatase [Kitasatospora purpeofusca]WSR35029.1 SpoIIE family protein phosphatase [Kitasatospora purpeofusca]